MGKLLNIDDINILFDTEIITVEKFIIDKIEILKKLNEENNTNTTTNTKINKQNSFNKDEIDIVINRLFEIFCSKLVDLNKEISQYDEINTQYNEINKRVEAVSIIIINILNYKKLSKIVK